MDTPFSVPAEARDSLALAVIASSNAPVLLLDGALNVIAASDSFCTAFDIERPPVAGAPFSAIGAGEWDVPQLGSLLRATAAGLAEIDAYEMDLDRPGRVSCRLVINARRLDHGDPANIRLILSIADVTTARIAEKLKNDLLREKEILLQELQHRVANSLQIIASVLMQSAKKVRSEQARGHLRDARNRVMSIATMQRQLANTRLGDVALHAYFTELCASIGASMIDDHDQLSLDVTADGSMARAEVSTSLGLIVTELVINALKHAFPHHRHGKILVDYRSDGPGWTLSVRDTGIGMPAGSPRPGLGTGIVAALAGQLNAVVQITAANPGTIVSIVHG
jgi:two-component sensor histidine kinase